MTRASRQFILIVVIIYAAAVDAGGDNKYTRSIFFRRYIGPTPEEYTDYSLYNVSTLKNDVIDNRPTAVYIHGHLEDLESESVRTVVQAYLDQNDEYIITICWAKLANEPYDIVVKNFCSVGTIVAKILNELVQNGFDSEKIYIIGFGVGAHIAGDIGRKAKFEVSRIIGLDPAGPYFDKSKVSLSSAAALVVHIIYTNSGIYGTTKCTGTANFFPNGDQCSQPGCPDSKSDCCSHSRSWTYYAESVNNKSSFIAVQCPCWSSFSSGKCNNNTQVIMGYGTPSNANGKYFLTTAAQSPFGLGEKGAQVIAE